MDTSIIANTLITTGITVTVNVIAYMVFYRHFQKYRRLENRLDDLENQEIKVLQAGVKRGSDKREKIYEKMETNFVTRRECETTKERHSQDIERIEKTISGMGVQLTEVSNQLAGTTTAIELMTDRVNLLAGA